MSQDSCMNILDNFTCAHIIMYDFENIFKYYYLNNKFKNVILNNMFLKIIIELREHPQELIKIIGKYDTVELLTYFLSFVEKKKIDALLKYEFRELIIGFMLNTFVNNNAVKCLKSLHKTYADRTHSFYPETIECVKFLIGGGYVKYIQKLCPMFGKNNIEFIKYLHEYNYKFEHRDIHKLVQNDDSESIAYLFEKHVSALEIPNEYLGDSVMNIFYYMCTKRQLQMIKTFCEYKFLWSIQSLTYALDDTGIILDPEYKCFDYLLSQWNIGIDSCKQTTYTILNPKMQMTKSIWGYIRMKIKKSIKFDAYLKNYVYLLYYKC